MTTPFDPSRLRALVFDVFGTLVDWRTSVARAAQSCVGAQTVDAAWSERLADAWRDRYQPSMEAVRSGARAYVTLDTLHRETLDGVLTQLGQAHVDAPTRDQLTHAWHTLDAWSDVGEGLRRLRPSFRLAPCSNGNVALMVNLARHNAWHWDAIVGADLARNYKPQAVVYRAACEAFNARPDEVLMVAAHSSDLEAAAQAGLRTAFIARPDEHGPGRGERQASTPVDLSADNLIHLAQQLGC